MEAKYKGAFLHSPVVGIIYTQIPNTIGGTRKTHFQIDLQINTHTKHCVYFKNANKYNRNRHEDVRNAAVL